MAERGAGHVRPAPDHHRDLRYSCRSVFLHMSDQQLRVGCIEYLSCELKVCGERIFFSVCGIRTAPRCAVNILDA